MWTKMRSLLALYLMERVYNKRGEYQTGKMCSECNVILHVWHGIRVT